MREASACLTSACCDRFYTEEAYSFRVRELFPDALRILDMQDMHSLRAGQLTAACAAPKHVLSQISWGHLWPEAGDLICVECAVRQAVIERGGSLTEALTTPPLANEPVLQRELAAIHRYCTPS